MQKLFFLLLVCIAGIFNAYGSHKTDSLEQVLKTYRAQDTVRIRILHSLAWAFRTNDPDRALGYSREALHIADSGNYPFWKAQSLDQIGVICQMKLQNREGLFYHLQALRIYQSIPKPYHIGSCLNNIALVYVEAKKFDIAKKYLIEAERIGDAFRGADWLIGCYSNLGIVTWELGEPNESISWFTKCVDESLKAGRPIPVFAYMNLAEIYKSRNQLDKARECCLKAIAANKNDSYLQAGCMQLLGEISSAEGNFNEAIAYFDQARIIAEGAGIKLELKNIYRNTADMYEKKGDFKNAFKYYKVFNQLKDSSISHEFTRQISEMQIKYETERKDEEIAKLSQAQLLADQKAEKAKIVRNSFITAFALIFIISTILARNSYLSKKINSILQQTNQRLNEKSEQIEKQKLEIELINVELNKYNMQLMDENAFARYEVLKSKTDPHFLFNSLASLSAIVKDNETASEFIERFTDLYRMILETGNQELTPLREEMEVVNNYLYLEKVRFGENIVINTHIEEALLEYHLPPFALQIAVENAFKHNVITDRKKLTIDIYTEDGAIIVRNNLQKKYKVVSTYTGQKNIKDRYRMLSDRQPEFIETLTEYMVKLPLLSGWKKEEVA